MSEEAVSFLGFIGAFLSILVGFLAIRKELRDDIKQIVDQLISLREIVQHFEAIDQKYTDQLKLLNQTLEHKINQAVSELNTRLDYHEKRLSSLEHRLDRRKESRE